MSHDNTRPNAHFNDEDSNTKIDYYPIYQSDCQTRIVPANDE
eukprot:gene45769-61180_t